jgi:hypothetical protein
MSYSINPAELRRQRLERKQSIRRRVVAGAVALFVAVWLMIAVVLVSGHDPALARKSGTAGTVAARTTTSAAQTTTTAAAQSSGGSGSTQSSSSSPTVVTRTS